MLSSVSSLAFVHSFIHSFMHAFISMGNVELPLLSPLSLSLSLTHTHGAHRKLVASLYLFQPLHIIIFDRVSFHSITALI